MDFEEHDVMIYFYIMYCYNSHSKSDCELQQIPNILCAYWLEIW